MIVALWSRWTRDHHYRWLALCLGVLALDMLIGSALVAYEVRLIREAW